MRGQKVRNARIARIIEITNFRRDTTTAPRGDQGTRRTATRRRPPADGARIGKGASSDSLSPTHRPAQGHQPRRRQAHRDRAREAEVIQFHRDQRRTVSLVYGLSLYIDAFPDAITPTNMRDSLKNRESGRNIRIARSSILNEEDRNSVSPHFRRGHFRVLESERFTKKKGQTIFVKGTFIKGRSYDVHNDSQPTPTP